MQFCTGEHEVAQPMFQRLLARRVQTGCRLAGGDRLVLGVEPLIGPLAGEEFSDCRQHGVIGLAQFGTVGDGVQMADRTPGMAESLGRHAQRGR